MTGSYWLLCVCTAVCTSPAGGCLSSGSGVGSPGKECRYKRYCLCLLLSSLIRLGYIYFCFPNPGLDV